METDSNGWSAGTEIGVATGAATATGAAYLGAGASYGIATGPSCPS